MVRVWNLSAALLLAAGVGGCSSPNSACLQAVEAHPGMTCLDVGLGWYHAQFVSRMPTDQRSDEAAASGLPISSTLSSN